MQDRYLKCDTVEGCWLDLAEAGLAGQDDEGNWQPAEGVSVSVIADLVDPGPEFDSDGNLISEGTHQGPHCNVRCRDDADALDSAPLSNGSKLTNPATPYRVWG